MPTQSLKSTASPVHYSDSSLQSPSSFNRALNNPNPETSLPVNDLLDNEIDLTEEELRELYDTEEINRFLGLFSAFVTEVQEKDNPKHEDAQEMDKTEQSQPLSASGALDNDGDWTAIGISEEPSPTSTPTKNASLSEAIAYRYLVPILPPARPEAPPFTIGRLRLILQRLYLATVPTYGPFLQNLLILATWKNPSSSLLYCALYWMLWWQNLLVTALVLRILYSLLKRRIFPYPTLDDLRRHREEVFRADEFSQQVSERLSASSSAVTELWRLFKLYDLTNSKYKAKARGKVKSLSTKVDRCNPGCVHREEEPTVLDDSEVTKDIKRVGLQILENVAEFHERARNIFHWRKPASSQKYAIVGENDLIHKFLLMTHNQLIFLVFLVTLLPARYISKIVLFALGVFFWHIIPIIASLPPPERDRVFILLNDVPTDGEYAMELISRRVAGGLPINPPKPTKATKKQFLSHMKTPVGPQDGGAIQSRGSLMDWPKLGDVVSVGKSALNDVKRLKPAKIRHLHENWPLRHPLVPSFRGFSKTESSPDARTYPCQHSSGPGLITLTQSTLLFTSLMSQNPKIAISLASVKGLKKAGVLKGLHVRWYDSLDRPDGAKELKEDRFAWIAGRDELFARLVSSEGKHWITI